jgi:hypothetical protein
MQENSSPKMLGFSAHMTCTKIDTCTCYSFEDISLLIIKLRGILVEFSFLSADPRKIPWEKKKFMGFFSHRRKYPTSLFNLGVFLVFESLLLTVSCFLPLHLQMGLILLFVVKWDILLH